MNLAFKFNLFGVISFLVMCGLFYWLFPALDNVFLRYAVYAVFAACAFSACFLIVRRK
ncbi:hypothetical protein [Candidatus Avelusimicrobium alvi]|uniref:hypothetical protein n=1 Tax=Candidatus Avelusimicrobium alvi TaxID=3416221 RepID=UPI003D0E1E35